MSDDLINRSAVYNKLLELEELARNRVLDTPTNSPCYMRYVTQLNERTALKHLIADMPTAYDVDKVVEQLEEYAHSKICGSHGGCPYRNDDDMTCENCGAMGALEIVKSGMKE